MNIPIPGTSKQIGKLCGKHPEAGGMRYGNYRCVQCQQDSNARWRTQTGTIDSIRAKRNERHKRYMKRRTILRRIAREQAAHAAMLKARLAENTLEDV